MILLTDISYFQKPLEIVNIHESDSIAADVNRFIRMYEPKLLGDVLGWEFYSALQAALLINPLADNFQKLLFGDTYTDETTTAAKWRGIIETDESTLTFGAGSASYKNPQWLIVGQTVDGNGNIIIPADATTFTIPYWVGWQPLPERIGAGQMQSGVDFDYNLQTGAFALKNGDSFTNGERLFVQFQMQFSAPGTTTLSYKHSLISDYIYCKWMGDNITLSTGMGEKTVTPAGTSNASANGKIIDAWNDMSQWLFELWNYLEANKTVFPQWHGIGWRELRKYRKINPYF